MKSVKKIVLALAATTMLASCAKEITKAEAVKIAEGYDSANVIYKSAEAKIVIKYTFGKDCSEAVKAMYKDSEQTEKAEGEGVLQARITAAEISAYPESSSVFKADGKALEVTSKNSYDNEGIKVNSEEWFKTDENGYTLSVKLVMAMSGSALGVVYDVTATTTTTVSYVK